MPLTPIEALNKVVEDRLAVAKLMGFRTLANLANKGRVKRATATQINWDVDMGGEAAAWEAVTADGSNTNTGDTVPATLSIGSHRLKHQFSISKVTIQEAANRAPEDLADLFGAYTDRAVNALFRKLNQAIWLGDGTGTYGNFVGINKVADNAAVYAGIDPATWTSWTTLKLTNASNRAFTRDLMLDMDQLVSEQESLYDLVTCTPAIAKAYTKVWDTVAANYSVPVSESSSALKSVDLGHGGRFYNGIPIAEDPQATNNAIWLMNSSDVDLYLFELSNDPASPGMGRHVVNNSYELPIHIAELPSNNSAVRRFEFFVLPQMRVRNRKSLMVIEKLTA